MKTLLKIIAALLILGAGVWFFTKGPTPQVTEVSVLRDITSPHLAQPDALDILPLFGLGNNKWAGGYFRFANLSDVSMNADSVASIDASNAWQNSEPDRDEAIQKFNNSVTRILSDAKKDTIGRTHSSLYIAIANELNRLSQHKGKRILLVYSDLAENTSTVSFYSKQTFNLLQTAPDKVQQRLNAEVPLNNLHGVEVHLIYLPETPAEDTMYRVISKFYKQMLESAGATVTISANLNN